MPKVLHFTNTAFFAQRLLEDKLQALADCGYFPVVAAPDANTLNLGCKTYNIAIARDISPVKDAEALIRSIKIIKDSCCDLVHTHSAKAGFIGRMAAYALDVPCIHTAHGLPFYDGQGKLSHSLYKHLEIMASNRCDCVLCQNHADTEKLRSLARNAYVLYEGNEINFERIQSYSNCRHQARVRLGLLDEDIAIGFFARIEPIKRHDLFIKAFDELGCRNTVAVFAGACMSEKTEYEEHIKKLISNSTARGRCLDLGFLDDPLLSLCACDIVALTSEKEGMPRIIMEAMALGIPVCATAAVGTTELVIDGVNGLLSPIGDPAAFSANLNRLCMSNELRRKLGENGKLYAEQELSLSKVINRITSAYHHVLNTHYVR